MGDNGIEVTPPSPGRPPSPPPKDKKEKKKKKLKQRTLKSPAKTDSKKDKNRASLPTPATTRAPGTPKGQEMTPERLEFEALFKRILHDEIAENRGAFALSMPSFGLTPDEQCAVWIREYKKAVDDERSGIRPPVRNPLPLRQLQFLREWISLFEPEFSLEQHAQLAKALEDGRDADTIVPEFKELFAQHHTVRTKSPREPEPGVGLANFPRLHSVPLALYNAIMGVERTDKDEEAAPPVDILSGSASVIARQLTCIEHQLFKAVRPGEFLNLTWVKHPDKAVNLLNMSVQFNRVSYWVATEIVLTKSVKDQISITRKFVQICKELLALNNFNTLMEILAGLNHVAVQRLKRMWERMPSSVMHQFTELEELMSTQQNFVNYRERLTTCTPPALPYLGVYLRDMTFIYDGNAKFTEEGRINFDLLVLVYERWKELRQFQDTSYPNMDKIKFDHILDTLAAYDHHDEDLLYNMSLQSQPSIWANQLSHSESTFSLPLTDGSEDLNLDVDDDSSESNSKDPATPKTPKHRKPLLDHTESDDTRTEGSDDSVAVKPRPLGDMSGMESEEERPRSPRKKRHAADAVVREKDKLMTVTVPPAHQKAYLRAETIVDKYFAHCFQSKRFGTIEIFEQRYLLMRAPSLSVDFVTTIHKDLEWLISQADATKFANKLLFDFAYTLGKSDANNFSQKMMTGDRTTAETVLFAEPITLAYLGWSFVDVHKGINVDPDRPQDFYMCFDRVYSFESAAWKKHIEEKKTKPKHAICVMSCGYTSGWCSAAFNTSLVTVEVLCKAKGDPTCTFITAPPQSIESHVDKYCSECKLAKVQKKAITVHDLDLGKKKGKKKSPMLKKSKDQKKSKAIVPVEPIVPAKLPSYDPKDEKKAVIIDRMKRIEMKGTRLAFALFNQRVCDVARGTVEVNKEPYVFLRARAMSVEFFPLIQGLYPAEEKEAGFEFATKFLLDFGISLGKADFKHYTTKMKLSSSSPVAQLFALPRVLAELGWGQMDVDYKTARLTQTEKKIFLRYKLKRSAEAMAWNEERKTNKNALKPQSPVCIMHTGYMNGFMAECFGDKADLAVVEVCCEGQGDHACEFLLAPRQRIERLAAGYLKEKGLPLERIGKLEVLRVLEKRSKMSKKAIKADNWGF